MKLIDFDKKIAEVEGDLVSSVQKAAMPKKEVVVNEHRLKMVLKVISNELLKDPVIVSLMSLRNDPTPKSQESFLGTVKTHIDYATAYRYREMFDGVFSEKEVRSWAFHSIGNIFQGKQSVKSH